MTRRALIAGAGMLTAGRMVSQALALVRHVIVGRMLSPDDLGVAAVLMVTSALLDLTTRFSVDKLLIQAKDGDDPGLLRTSHAFSALRGLALGVVAVGVAVPIAGIFGIREAAWAFAVFAVTPVIYGFRHLDSRRFQRGARFGPDVAVEVGAQVIVTLAAWPAVTFIGGYAAVVWLLVAKAVITVVASHLVAERRYAWSWDRAHVRRILAFGWPLLASGAVMFLITQGDQAIVGGGYSMHELGLYAVAATLTLAMSTMVMSISSTLLLPVLARHQDDAAGFERVYAGGAIAHAAVGAVVGAGLIVAGPAFVTMLYGDAYRGAGAVVGWLGAMQCMRLLRVMPTVAALSLGDTFTSLVTNLWRVSVLPCALVVAWAGMSPVWIAVVGVAGECAALVAVTARVRRVHGIAPTWVYASSAVCGGVCALAGMSVAAVAQGWGAAIVAIAAGCLAVGAFAIVICRRAFAGRRLPVWGESECEAGVIGEAAA